VVEQGGQLPVQQGSVTYQAPVYADASGSASAVNSAPQQPAVVALLQQAEAQANAGELESAAASLERAIRIDARNPVIWYHLATVRLSQGEAAQAEQLANKSNSLAPGNHAQQSRNWILIAESRRQMNDRAGAAAAEQHARELAAN
jgi:cytochrome c-type biogenesis protein CcmH/NrfG